MSFIKESRSGDQIYISRNKTTYTVVMVDGRSIVMTKAFNSKTKALLFTITK